MAPLLSLMLEAYGIGIPTESHPNPLAAPQAGLMAAVAQGVFTLDLPWDMVGIGALVAVFFIVLDIVLEKKGGDFRTPVLAVAVGIYLPLELEVPILLGGLLAWAAGRVYTRSTRRGGHQDEAPITEAKETGERNGQLFAAGLITGEALLGILLAIPIVVWGTTENPNPLAFWGDISWTWPGLVLLALVMFGLYLVAVKPAGKLKKTSGR
jgi:putative OPT family oligopeptide transporter